MTPERRGAADDVPWRPGDSMGWESYHERMYGVTESANAWYRWKVKSTGVNVARAVRAIRNRARASWLDEHGQSPDRWQHPPAVLWLPECAYAGCLGCDWLGLDVWTPDKAAEQACEHAAEHIPADAVRPALLDAPLRVWRRDAPGDGPGPEWAGREQP